MKTIRPCVFETNSSSEHCITVSDELRTADEMPALNPDGILEIEAKIKWECGQPGTTTDDVRDIMDYLCAMAFCLTPWDASAEAQKLVRTKSFESLLWYVQEAYKSLGLEPPKGIFYYFTDVNGKKYRYDGTGMDNVIKAPDGDGIIEAVIDGEWDQFTEEDFAVFEKRFPSKVAKCIRTKYPIDVNHNLMYGEFSELSFEEYYCGEETYGIKDLLTKRFTLDFYRT